MRNALNKLADTVQDPAEKKVSIISYSKLSILVVVNGGKMVVFWQFDARIALSRHS